MGEASAASCRAKIVSLAVRPWLESTKGPPTGEALAPPTSRVCSKILQASSSLKGWHSKHRCQRAALRPWQVSKVHALNKSIEGHGGASLCRAYVTPGSDGQGST